jgi:heterodisulfide reductase subunit A
VRLAGERCRRKGCRGVEEVSKDLATTSDKRIGVFVCQCGTNIGGFLDVPVLVEYSRSLPYVVFSIDNLYTCSDTGLTEIRDAISENGLNRVVVASCTPRTHEPLFRSVCREEGLNPYLFEFVNIRDQCSWVHMREPEAATEKAKDLIRMGVARAALLEPQEGIEIEVTPSAMVIGGGVAGMTCSLSLANQGFDVKLVERENQLGGNLNGLHRLYPTNEYAAEFVQKLREGVEGNKRINVLTSSNVKTVEGFVGNYDVVVDQADNFKQFKVGAIIVATGAESFRPDGLYGYDGESVITQLELEKLLRDSEIDADSVVMIQCVGSRDESRPYCSKICCMNAIKNATLIREADPETQVYILYRDIQTHGRRYEDYYREAREKGVVFVKYPPGRPPEVDGGDVRVFDELMGEDLILPFDLVVLSSAMVAHGDNRELAQMLKVPVDDSGFFLEAHVKLRPVDFATDGLFLCGCARWPCDIGESVSQAYAAASRASVILSTGRVISEPITAMVDEEKCSGCGLCEMNCPFKAIRIQDTEKGRIAEVIEASCKGCGMCGAGCPQRAISMRHFSDEQLVAQIDALSGVGL